MKIYKTPTHEEINRAITNKWFDTGYRPNDDSKAFAMGFKACISWLQSYQTKHATVVETKGVLLKAFQAGEAFQNECFCGNCDYCKEHTGEKAKPFHEWIKDVTYQTQQQGAVISAEEIIEQIPYVIYDGAKRYLTIHVLSAMHEFHNQFQTPASGKNIEEYAKNYQENSDLTNHNAVYYAVIAGFIFGQSSQPQPNAISVIEEEIKRLEGFRNLDKKLYDGKIDTAKLILTKLKRQLRKIKITSA